MTRPVKVLELGHDMWQIDLMEQNSPGRTYSFVVKDSLNVLIETGSSLAIGEIIQGLHELNIPRDELHYIIVTHIHLDHAGGVGTLAKLCPNAKIVVHPRAARHMIDPSRLIAGATAVYGDKLHEYFGQILPVPENRVIIMNDGDTLTLGANRKFTFIDTPGHAKHHFSIFDSLSQSMFTGDTLGIRYIPVYTGWDFEFVLPSTSPTDFDPEATHQSIEKISRIPVKQIIHTHGGVTLDPQQVYATIAKAVDAFAAFVQDTGPEEQWQTVAERMVVWIHDHLLSLGHAVEDFSPLSLDLEVNCKGLLYYAQMLRQQA